MVLSLYNICKENGGQQQTLSLSVTHHAPLPRIWYLKVVYEVCYFKQAGKGLGAAGAGCGIHSQVIHNNYLTTLLNCFFYVWTIKEAEVCNFLLMDFSLCCLNPTNYRKIASNETIQKIIQINNVYFKNICKRLFFKCANGWMFFENWDYLLCLCFRRCDTQSILVNKTDTVFMRQQRHLNY